MVDEVSEPEGKIVEYEPSMAEDIAEMFNEFKESWPGGFGGGIPFDEESIRDRYDESSSITDFIALDEDDTPVGICTLLPHWRDPDAAYVGLLGVVQRVKGKKYGKRLLLKSIERAIEKEISRIDLHTWSGNLNAMPLYKKVGMLWVPDTSVYMQDYIPLLHQNAFTKRWFEQHEDWYGHQKRELKQEPDDRIDEGMNIYRYRFEHENDWLEVDIDRYGWGIIGINRKIGEEEFAVKAELDSHRIYIGIENAYVLKFENHTDEKKEIDIQVDTFEGLEFKEALPSKVTLEKGEKKTISREFIVDDEAETYETSHKISETIDTTLNIDQEEFALTTGGKIKPAVEIDSPRDLFYLFSEKEKEINFDLKNNTEKELSGEITFRSESNERSRDFTLEKKEHGGISLPVKLEFKADDVKNIEITPSIEKETGFFPMETYKQPLVNDTAGLLASAEKEDEVYLVNDELKVKAELEGGYMSVSERARDSELPFKLRQKIGPPFGKTQDSTLRYDHELVEDKKGLHLVLRAESRHRPGILIKKHVRVQKRSKEVEFWSELKNVSDGSIKAASETSTRSWGFETEPYQSKAKVYTPLNDELVESDPTTYMLSGTLLPTDPEEWEETWTAYEDIADGAVSGLMWSNNSNVKKVKLVKGLLDELKSVTKELEPGESFKSTHLWISVKRPSLNSFRDAWNRLVGKKDIHPNQQVYGKETRRHIEARLDDNILRSGEVKKSERIITIEKVVDYPMPGEYSIRSPDHMNVSFENDEDKIEVSEEEDRKRIHLPIYIDVSEETTSCVECICLHFSGERELNFELPVIIVEDDKEVEVEEGSLEGKKVLHVNNGEIRFDVLDCFGGNLIRLEDSEGNTYLDDRFPEPGPKSYFENHIGGIEPRLITPDDFESFYEIEEVSSQKVNNGRWKGVKVDFTIEKLGALRAQDFSIKYLTLPGIPLIKIVMVHDNPKSREVNWLGELFIDILMNDNLKGTVVECPGKYEVYKRESQTQNFLPPANIEESWFYFEKEDVSIGGFSVEGSPAYSVVLCNEEINMAFLAANMMSLPLEREEIQLGIMVDQSKDKLKTARRALSTE